MTECHPVIFLGVGPGDPELITVKGQRAHSKLYDQGFDHGFRPGSSD